MSTATRWFYVAVSTVLIVGWVGASEQEPVTVVSSSTDWMRLSPP